MDNISDEIHKSSTPQLPSNDNQPPSNQHLQAGLHFPSHSSPNLSYQSEVRDAAGVDDDYDAPGLHEYHKR